MAIDYQSVLDTLNMPNLTTESVKDVLRQQGITTQAAADKWAQENAAPAPSGPSLGAFLGNVAKGGERIGGDVTGALQGPAGTALGIFGDIAQPEAALPQMILQHLANAAGQKLSPPAKEGAKKPKADANLPTPTAQQSPYEQLANALAQSYLQQTGQLQNLISGESLFGPQGQTENLVTEASNAIPGAAGFLQGAAAQEQSDAGPLEAAMKQYGAAQQAATKEFAPAIASTGAANTQYLAGAPYGQILQELANQTAYRAASQGSSAFGGTPATTPEWLNQIYQRLGLGGTGGPGNVGLTPPKVAATGGTSGTTGGSGTNPGGGGH